MTEPREIAIRETTQGEVSNVIVGVRNIWERELPDEDGAIATRMSASVSVHDPVSGALHDQHVYAGSIVLLGGVRYRVLRVAPGDHAPGWLTLRAES
jgi:hypothetical protein